MDVKPERRVIQLCRTQNIKHIWGSFLHYSCPVHNTVAIATKRGADLKQSCFHKHYSTETNENFSLGCCTFALSMLFSSLEGHALKILKFSPCLNQFNWILFVFILPLLIWFGEEMPIKLGCGPSRLPSSCAMMHLIKLINQLTFSRISMIISQSIRTHQKGWLLFAFLLMAHQ